MSKFLDLAFKTFGKDSVSKALSISKNSVSFYDTLDRGKNDLVHIFKVNSQHYNYYYDVNIITRHDSIVSFYCECTQFSNNHTCKHVAACLINYGDMILESAHTDLDISNNILDIFKNNYQYSANLIVPFAWCISTNPFNIQSNNILILINQKEKR